ncbi:hypothetical protein Dimus_023119 [Dionaea muscipula]
MVMVYEAKMVIGDEDAFESPTPIDTWFGLPLPPQPRPGYYKYLGDRIDKTTQACGVKISKAIFGNGKSDDSLVVKRSWKQDIFAIAALTYILAKFDKFKPYAATIFQNGEAIFDQCSKS